MRTVSILVAALLLMTGMAVGQPLDDHLMTAARENPGLRAGFDRYRAALERVPQVGALPDPQLAFGFFIMPMQRYMGDQMAEISLMQMFPWFGTLGAAKDEMAFMAKARFEEFKEARSMLYYEVKANWYALYLLEKEIAIMQDNIALLTSMEQVALSRYSGGGQASSSQRQGRDRTVRADPSGSTMGMGGMNAQGQGQGSAGSAMAPMADDGGMGGGGSMVDVLRVQMEINGLRNDLALLEDSRMPLLARFNLLLNRPPAEPVTLPDSLRAASMPVPVSELPDSIRGRNPMLRMLEQEEAAFLASERMNRKMGFPMIGIGLQYDIFRPRANSESTMNGRNMLMPMATVSIPIWRKGYSASVREAGHLRQAAADERQDTDNRLMADHGEVLRDFRDADRRIALYADQTALADQALRILMVRYTTEGSDFEEVLRMQQQLLDYRLRTAGAVVDSHIAVAMMERLMGR